jgi:hypothetical protein
MPVPAAAACPGPEGEPSGRLRLRLPRCLLDPALAGLAVGEGDGLVPLELGYHQGRITTLRPLAAAPGSPAAGNPAPVAKAANGSGRGTTSVGAPVPAKHRFIRGCPRDCPACLRVRDQHRRRAGDHRPTLGPRSYPTGVHASGRSGYAGGSTPPAGIDRRSPA